MKLERTNYQLLIEKLDRFIRKYYVNQIIRGLLYSVGTILALFLLANLLEHNFYFHKNVRTGLLFGFLAMSGAALVYWVVVPLLHYFNLGKIISHEQAAQIIGNHFEDVQDKLLNILQLKKQENSVASTELIEASIQQKAETIKLVPFPNAIDLRKNRKYLKFALPPLLLLLLLLIAAPSLIKDSTRRLVHINQEFEKEAPFAFAIQNDKLEVVQYDDYTLNIEVDGSILPDDAFIRVEDFEYRLQKSDANHFSYVFNNVQKDLDFQLFSGNVASRPYTLHALKKPVVMDFDVVLQYPGYIQRPNEVLKNMGDLILPAGTKINWVFRTSNADQIQIKLPKSEEKAALEQKGANQFEYQSRVTQSGNYQLFLSNSEMPYPDSVQYAIQVIPDQYPTIDVKQFLDSTNQNLQYFAGSATDDYGLSTLSFNYQITHPNGNKEEVITIPVQEPNSKATQYAYTLDVQEIQLKPGDQLNYYFEVYDNDAVNGRKSSRTQSYVIEKATREELEAKADDNNDAIRKQLEKSLQESRKMQEEIQKMRDKLLQKEELDWQDKKELEKLLQKHNELEDLINQAKEKFQENKKQQSEFSDPSQQLQEKQEKLEELFEESVTDEMKDLMKQIEDLMQKLDKDNLMEMMQKFQFTDNEKEMELDRLLELFKQMEVEQDLEQAMDKLNELAEQEEKLSDKTEKTEQNQDTEEQSPDENKGESQEEKKGEQKEEPLKQEQEKQNQEQQDKQQEQEQKDQQDQKQDPSDQEKLQDEQEQINQEFNKLEEKLDEIQKKNEQLERPKDLGNKDEQRDDIQQDLKDSQENLQKQQNKQASKKQKSAAQKMKQMAEQMQSQMQNGQMEQMQEDMAALRQLLENLIGMSFEQESVMNQIGSTDPNTPTFVGLVQDQYKLKDNFSLIEDSLQALSKRVVQIESFVNEKVTAVKENMTIGLERLEDRQVRPATDNQQRIMTNVNDLALMLSEAMQQMQQQMASMMSGSQMCDNPGGTGIQLPDKMQDAGDQLQDQMQKMKQSMQEGQGQGKQQMSSEQFAKMAAKQAAIRKLLEEVQKAKQESGQGSRELEELIKQLDKVETELVNKELSNETLKRQQEILTKLLEAERAERQRGEEEKRKSETGKEVKRELPPSLQEYLKKRESEIQQLKYVSPDVNPYYKQLIEEYLKLLKNEQ